MSLKEACEIVMLDPEDYIEPSPQSRLSEPLPTPEEIAQMCAEFRATDREEDDDREQPVFIREIDTSLLFRR